MTGCSNDNNITIINIIYCPEVADDAQVWTDNKSDSLVLMADGLKPTCTESDILSNLDVCVSTIVMDSEL